MYDFLEYGDYDATEIFPGALNPESVLTSGKGAGRKINPRAPDGQVLDCTCGSPYHLEENCTQPEDTYDPPAEMREYNGGPIEILMITEVSNKEERPGRGYVPVEHMDYKQLVKWGPEGCRYTHHQFVHWLLLLRR